MDPELYEAAINGSLENFTSTADPNHAIPVQDVTCDQRNTILHVATIGGNERVVEEILETNPVLLKVTNKRGETALHIAARLGYENVASILVEKAVDDGSNDVLTMASTHCDEKNTALHEAVRNGHYDIVELLIDAEPSLACLTNGIGESPLFMAIDRKFYEIAHHILGRYPDCSCSGRNGMNVMHAAVIRLNYNPIRFYMRLEGNAKNDSFWMKFGITLNKLSISCLNIPILGFRQACKPSFIEEDFVDEMLKKCGPEILKVQDDDGWVPLHYAAHIGKEKIVALFLEMNKSLAYIKDKKGMSALHIAAANGRNYVVSDLVEMCPDVCELLDDRGRTALHVAVEAGFRNVVNNLLYTIPFNDLINEKDEHGNTALHLAAIHGRHGILRRLANDRRVDKGAINKAGMTAFDIIRSTTGLTHDRKGFIMTILKRKGLQPSLERRVVTLEKRLSNQQIDNDDPTRVNEITQDITSELFPKNELQVAAASNNATSFMTSTKEEKAEKLLKKRHKRYYGWSPEHIKNLANVNLVVATIIASITFAAGMAMPGGYDDTDGLAILRTKDSFRSFLFFDSLAFGCSTASMCIHFLVAFTSRFIGETYVYPISGLVCLTLLSIASTVIAFITGTNSVLRHRSGFGLSANISIISFILPVSYYFVRLVRVLFKMLHFFISSRK